MAFNLICGLKTVQTGLLKSFSFAGYRRNGMSTGNNRPTTPTIILLPFGRMLVVDRSVFEQFNVDQRTGYYGNGCGRGCSGIVGGGMDNGRNSPGGIDFMELSANLIRAHRMSTPSVLDSETSKCATPLSIADYTRPPSYAEIYDLTYDLPPSYSELSLKTKCNAVTRSVKSGAVRAISLRVVRRNDDDEGGATTRNDDCRTSRSISDGHINDLTSPRLPPLPLKESSL